MVDLRKIIGDAALSWRAIGRSVMGYASNVEVIRTEEGAARAPHEMCLTQVSDTMIGST